MSLILRGGGMVPGAGPRAAVMQQSLGGVGLAAPKMNRDDAGPRRFPPSACHFVVGLLGPRLVGPGVVLGKARRGDPMSPVPRYAG
jgi:hypothetical protein